MDPSIPDEADDADVADDVVFGDEEPIEVFLAGDCIIPAADDGST